MSQVESKNITNEQTTKQKQLVESKQVVVGVGRGGEGRVGK